jgi:hypothetical protein
MSASKLFAEVSPALSQRILEEVYATDKELYRVAISAVAQAKKVRPVFLERQPRAERHRTMAAALARPDLGMITGNVLSGWLVKNQQPLLIDFLTALKIPHQNGVVENLPATVDDTDLKNAIDLLLGKNPPEIVGLYLHAFRDMNDVHWPTLNAILAEDTRLMLGA